MWVFVSGNFNFKFILLSVWCLNGPVSLWIIYIRGSSFTGDIQVADCWWVKSSETVNSLRPQIAISIEVGLFRRDYFNVETSLILLKKLASVDTWMFMILVEDHRLKKCGTKMG